MTEGLEARYTRDSNVVSREVAGEQVLVPIQRGSTGTAAIFVLNETGSMIWDLVDGERSLSEIRDALVAEYDVEPVTASSDILELVEQLEEIGALGKV